MTAFPFAEIRGIRVFPFRSAFNPPNLIWRYLEIRGNTRKYADAEQEIRANKVDSVPLMFRLFHLVFRLFPADQPPVPASGHTPSRCHAFSRFSLQRVGIRSLYSQRTKQLCANERKNPKIIGSFLPHYSNVLARRSVGEGGGHTNNISDLGFTTIAMFSVQKQLSKPRKGIKRR